MPSGRRETTSASVIRKAAAQNPTSSARGVLPLVVEVGSAARRATFLLELRPAGVQAVDLVLCLLQRPVPRRDLVRLARDGRIGGILLARLERGLGFEDALLHRVPLALLVVGEFLDGRRCALRARNRCVAALVRS